MAGPKGKALGENMGKKEKKEEKVFIDASAVYMIMSNSETGEEGKISLPQMFNQLFQEFGSFHGRLLELEEEIKKLKGEDSKIINPYLTS